MDLNCRIFDHKTQLAQQRQLFIDCFPENIGTKTVEAIHYYWKFQNFPGNLKSYEYTAYIENEMVGYYAAIPYIYKIGDKTTPVAMVCDVMTSSKHRGKGIFTKLGRFSTQKLKEEGMPFSIGYPIREEVIPGHLKVGWKIAFDLPLYVKFIKLNSLLKSKRLSILSFIANPIMLLYNRIRKEKIDISYSWEIVKDIDSIGDYDGLVDKWMKTAQNTLVKNSPFAKWRYNAPGRKYHFLTIRKDGYLVAFVSYRNIIKKNVPSLGLLDFIVLPEYRNCIGLINYVLIQQAKEEKIEAVICMMSRCSAKQYHLLKNGFLKSPYKFRLIIKNLTHKFSDEQLMNEQNWHLMWVDSDDL